jgi:hypothetical protein
MVLGKPRAMMIWWQLNLACGLLVTPALESTMIEHMHISIWPSKWGQGTAGSGQLRFFGDTGKPSSFFGRRH